ncbi:MAG: zinc ribbon domain-containing protein [Bryobacterales bacterium]|nr:zinc ribbon domain-containing protein [Bryobacterales bacterium]
MPRFCTHCGAPQSESASFCQGCGKPLQPQSAAPASAPSAPVKPASSSLLKFVLVAFAVIAILGMISVAGVIYAGYRVKNKVEQSAKDHGINLHDLTSPSNAAARHLDPCSLLTKEEAAQILNTPIIRAESSGEACNYYAKPLSVEEREANLRKAFEEVGKKAPIADSAPSSEKVRESGIGDLARQIVGSANDGSAPLFTITYSQDGKQQIAAMKIAIGAVSGNLASASLDELRGIGDQALLGPLDSMLVVEKNGAGVTIDLRQLPKAKQLAITMARRIVPRM